MSRNPLIIVGAVIVIALVSFVVVRSTKPPAPPSAQVQTASTEPAPAVPLPSAIGSTPAPTATSALPPMASPRAGMPGLPPVATSPALQEREPTKEEVAHIPRIKPEELLEKYEAKSVTIIDVRDADSYRERHIPGALHIPLAYIQGEIPYLPKDKPIVAYCT